MRDEYLSHLRQYGYPGNTYILVERHTGSVFSLYWDSKLTIAELEYITPGGQLVAEIINVAIRDESVNDWTILYVKDKKGIPVPT